MQQEFAYFDENGHLWVPVSITENIPEGILTRTETRGHTGHNPYAVTFMDLTDYVEHAKWQSLRAAAS